MKLRLASYNIHKGVLGVRRPRLTIYELRQHLHSLNADLVFLQEVQGRHDRHQAKLEGWPDEGQPEFLAAGQSSVGGVEGLLGHSSQTYFHVYGMNAVYPHGHHGNALLSSRPIDWSMNEDVSDHRFEQRGLLHVRVQTEAGPVHCLVAHLGLFGGSRRRQSRLLIRHIQRHVPLGAKLILAGDFNDWQRVLGREFETELGLSEVKPSKGLGRLTGYRSFPSRLPFLGLDRVFIRGFEVESAEVKLGSPWKELSDHAPLVVDLKCKL